MFPSSYLAKMETRKAYPRIAEDAKGQKRIMNAKDSPGSLVKQTFYDANRQASDMTAGGIDMAVITVSNPWVESLYRYANDEISRVVQEYPERFVGIGMLPLSKPAVALEELDRIVKDLHMKGVAILSNANGKPIDSPEFWPVFEKVAKLDVPVFLHPGQARNKLLRNYMMGASIGFPIETTIALARLITSGLLEKLPNLKIVVAHLGGTIPYLIGRIDQSFKSFVNDKKITKPPSYYLKQIYLDTICFSKPALMCAYHFMGPERLLFGTDYPFAWAALSEFTESINELDLPEREKGMIFGENAEKLLKL